MTSEETVKLPVVVLKPKADRRLKSGHRWIYSNEVDVSAADYRALEPGECANVQGARGELLGSACFNSHSLLCGRLHSRKPDTALDAQWVRQRLAYALSWRETCYRQPFYRLVYGDGDDLPGLVVNRYGDYLVVQITTTGMLRIRETLLEVLVDTLQPAGVVLRLEGDTETLQAKEQPGPEVAYGSVPDEVELVENGCDFVVPLLAGQKTGWFYDHRDNRRYLAKLAAGKSVLDVYSYLGAWGMQALAAGATGVTCIDSSSLALEFASRNAQLLQKRTGASGEFAALCGSAVEVLKGLAAEGRQYDIVILDPPAFIKRRKDTREGEKAYHRINQLAMRLLADSGLLASASCSLHLTEHSLVSIVSTAAARAGRDVKLVARGGLGPDHPLVPAIGEMNYLKAVFARIGRRAD